MGQAQRAEAAMKASGPSTPAHRIAEQVREREALQTSLTLQPIEIDANETAESFLRKIALNFGLDKQVITQLATSPFFVTENKRVSCSVSSENGKKFAHITVAPIKT